MKRPKSKVAFVLIDGVGDVNIPSLGFKTPLQAARTEILDAIAGRLWVAAWAALKCFS